MKTLQFVGVYGDQGMIAMAKRFGITSFDRNDYGLSLTLGGGDVSVLEMTSAFSVFANGGVRVPPVSILKIIDHQGTVVYQYTHPKGDQIISPEHSYLITSILSDNQARRPAFGDELPLDLPFPVAAKTGTAQIDARGCGTYNWLIATAPAGAGETPTVAIAAIVPIPPGSSCVDSTGAQVAGPVVAAVMQKALAMQR